MSNLTLLPNVGSRHHGAVYGAIMDYETRPDSRRVSTTTAADDDQADNQTSDFI
jgi:hypothetical protein